VPSNAYFSEQAKSNLLSDKTIDVPVEAAIATALIDRQHWWSQRD
jgi:hypothetical protein